MTFPRRLFAVALAGWLSGAIAARADDYQGPGRCLQCHTDPQNVRPALARFIGNQDFVLLRQTDIVLEEDKHAQAYKVLEQELGQRICKTLKIEKVDQAQQCLSCHANWLAKKERPEIHDLGVSCESCHGPSRAWDVDHSKPSVWRALSPAEKEAKGFVNVRDPRERANQCLSCHIGDPSQGKVITHEMYAAGHPPLPAIEMETFAQQMPRHWRYLSEKGDFDLRDKYIQATYGTEPEMPQTKAVLVGGVAVLKHWVALIGHEAKEAVEKPENWPELANYDCQACHHDLKTPAWRQSRLAKESGPPGRPDMPEWMGALARVGIAHLAADDSRARLVGEFDARLAKFQAVLKARPFGEPAAVAAAAEEFGTALENVSKKLSASPFDRARSQRDLDFLLNLPLDKTPDFQSARQLAWAAKLIATEIETRRAPPVFAKKAADETPDQARGRHQGDVKTFDAWNSGPRQEAAAKIDAVFGKLKLNETLKLQLPAGQKTKIEEELPHHLAASAAYDPEWFRKAWAQLGDDLRRGTK